MATHGRFFLLACILNCALAASLQGQPAAPSLSREQKLHIATESLLRLEKEDLHANESARLALDRVLKQVRGTEPFVQLVKRFDLKDQSDGLIEIVQSSSSPEISSEAARLLMKQDVASLKAALQGPHAGRVVEVLGATSSKEAVALLLPLLNDSKAELPVRKQAVRSLAQTEDGARKLLNLADQGGLPPSLKPTASETLHAVRWEPVRKMAETLLPRPQGVDASPLPSVAELLAMKGDRVKGEEIFFRAEVQCASCHQIGERGTDVGPALTEIGSKLGKEALLESILEPDAGISFGYEATQLELKSGDEPFGIVVSDTADEIALKDLKGVIARYPKADVSHRRQMENSIMPAGLQRALSAQELVDLVTFLTELKKALP